MERYTYRSPDGTALLTDELDGKYTANEVIDELAARLAAYEDTGLTPELIAEMRADATAMVKELAKVKTERDAAIAAIFKIAERGTTWMCPYCKNAKSIYSGMCDCALGIGVCQAPFTKFEWRGEKLEDSYYG